ncbi:MAG: flagellar export chaperone FliS [Candidatus Zixiibacteriota bacterium]|nr:MAG: flagellar export chaperone FliS [candidate division Zixibacteria bacterium]
MQDKTGTYEQINTLGKSPLELVIKVYDGAITAYQKATECYRDQRFDDGHAQLERGRKFMTHLYTTLDNEKGGEIANNLGRLYAFIINQTDVAQATKDTTVIIGNIKILRKLREGWAGIQETSDVEPGVTNDEPALAEVHDGFTTTG